MAQRLTVTFRKAGDARYLSHLDLMATLEFAIRRARLPIALAEGFNPRPRMIVAAPLPLGHIGEAEIFEITLTDWLEPKDVHGRLSAALPADIDILSVEEIPANVKSAASRLTSVRYRIDLLEPVDDLSKRVRDLMARETIEIEEEREGGKRIRDLRPYMLSVHAPNGRTLMAELALGGSGTIRPEQILDLLSIATDGVQFRRERIELR
jgi:radical SAM-linked protein